MTEKVYSNILLKIEAALRDSKSVLRFHQLSNKSKLQGYEEINKIAEEVGGKGNLPSFGNDPETPDERYWYWKAMIETLDSVEEWLTPEPTVLD